MFLNVKSFSIGFIKILGNNSSVDALLQKRKVSFVRQIFSPNQMFCSLVTLSNK